MSYSFVSYFADRDNIYFKNGYVYVKENTKKLQSLDIAKEEKDKDSDKVVVKAVTPVEKEIQITKSEYDIQTKRKVPPDTLDNKESVRKKRKLNISYNDALS